MNCSNYYNINIIDILFYSQINKMNDEYNMLNYFDRFKWEKIQTLKHSCLISFNIKFRKYKLHKYSNYGLSQNYNGLITYNKKYDKTTSEDFIYNFYQPNIYESKQIINNINRYLLNLIIIKDIASFEKLKLSH